MNQSLIIVGLVGCSHCMEFKVKYLNYITNYLKHKFSIPVIFYEITNKQDSVNNSTYDMLNINNFNVPCVALVHDDFFSDKDEYWMVMLDIQTIVNIIEDEYQLSNYFEEYIKSLNTSYQSEFTSKSQRRYYKLKRN